MFSYVHVLLRTFRVVEKKKNGIKNDTFPHFISVRTATVHTFFRNDQSIRISYWLASQFFFFFGSMLLRSFNDESSEVIAKDFFNLYFFPFSVGKKRSLRRRIRDLSCIVSSWPFIFVPFFSLFVSLNSCILCWASRPIDTTSSSLNFATRAHFPWQWQSVDDQALLLSLLRRCLD